MNILSPTVSRNRMIIGSCLLLLWLFLFSFLGSEPVLQLFGLTQINMTLFFISRLLCWLCVGLLWLYANKAEHQPLLLREEASYPLSTYVATTVILMLILFGGSVGLGLLLKLAKLNATSSRMAELVSLFRQHTWLLVFTSLTAGVTEELMFRGYLQTRFEKIFSNDMIAIILSSLLFGLLHFRYGTIANMLIPFFIGLVFAIYYRKYKNIRVLMICHFLWDLTVSFLLVNVHHV